MLDGMRVLVGLCSGILPGGADGSRLLEQPMRRR
ncbi:MAG: hypothetical protein QOJ26_485, partial [Thermoplasmata archaeon]|nr:hypothetical protein [Thermoplasmata archaeon]